MLSSWRQFDGLAMRLIFSAVLTVEPTVSKHLLILILAPIGLLIGCSHRPTYNEKPQPLGPRSFARQWATQLEAADDSPVTAVHVVDKFVFAYRRNGTSTVFDRTTGQMLHQEQPRGGAVRMHPPVLLKDRILYPTTTYLEAYDFQGRYVPHPSRPSDEIDKPFSQEFKFAIHSDVVAQGRYAFFGADFKDSGRAVEVDLTRPYVPEIWTLMMPGSSVIAAPAVEKQDVFFASENGQVSAVTIENREPIWTLERDVFGTYGGIIANLVLDNTDLYVASTDTKLYCLTAKSGKVKWQFYAGQALRQSPVVTKTTVYQHVPTTGLAAVDRILPPGMQNEGANRRARWIARDATQFLSEDDAYSYVVTGDNHIAALDKKTGEVKFVSRRNDFVAFGVNTTGDGVIYACDGNSRILAIRPVLEGGGVGEVVMAPAARPAIAIAR
jgi:outer membrane protein assembly factor BamB